ncbi:T9SS type A sorting domain-containing protein [Rubricoccus marinus]|uniref:Secretion system C-terminal sorting domain-containing protein n=1 Tax=Rubricoccus marinus TaxID=716817 RepID=A0A259U0K5_9BACT|nr:T9SS type A sorting domain-containing protein [Rubricoccus marinus]OZC03529.1 hypothetical protein BSZ36_11370 [Rubricoccus marinus]
MRLATFIAALALTAAPAAAQFGAPSDPCPEGTGEATLLGTNVQASLFTNGNLFFGNTTTNGDGYVVPLAGSGANNSPLFAANLWLGGRVGGEIRTAGARFGNFHLRPGRTGADGTPPAPEACAEADRIAVISTMEPRDSQTEAVRAWPADLGAPVIDGDGIPGNYDVDAGDRPAIRGDVMAFWAMTDTATDRAPSGDPLSPEFPLGVDVTVEAFTLRQLPTTTFYRFTLTNRNSVAIEDAALGIFFDWDLGDASDDYVGTDTTLQMSYVYNASETDTVYGIPPAAGAVVLEGLAGVDDERQKLTASPIIFKSGGFDTYGVPLTPAAYYNRLLGLFGDGSPTYEYAFGYAGLTPSPIPAGTPTTRFGFTGDPVAGEFWSEENWTGSGESSPSGDRRDLAATGPVRLEPGESAHATYAIVFAQGSDRLDSITRLRAQAQVVGRAASAGGFPLQAFENFLQAPPPPSPVLTLTRPRPNPFSESATVRMTGASGARASVSVYDVLGRRLSRVDVEGAPEAEVEVGAGLPSGVYIVRVEGLGFGETFTIVKAK